jgi:hypothetical protein
MKIENLLIGLGAILVILLILAKLVFVTASLEIHLYDTYYIINGVHVIVFCLLVAILDFIGYKLIRYRLRELNTWISVLQIGSLILFFGLILLIWLEQQEGDYFQSSIPIWALTLLILSQLLLIVHSFLPKKTHFLPG